MREKKFYFYLDETEYQRVLQSLLQLKNSLIQQGKYTDGVDDVLCKFVKAKKNTVCLRSFKSRLLRLRRQAVFNSENSFGVLP